MKICIVCPYGIDSPGGVWNHVFNLTQQLKKKRINHILVTPKSNTDNHYQNNHYKIGKTFNINSGGSRSQITFSFSKTILVSSPNFTRKESLSGHP